VSSVGLWSWCVWARFQDGGMRAECHKNVTLMIILMAFDSDESAGVFSSCSDK